MSGGQAFQRRNRIRKIKLDGQAGMFYILLMARTAFGIDRVAEMTGWLRASVFRVARAIREDDPTLFPAGELGRGRGTHLEPAHLNSLLIGIGVGDPITAAPALVRAYRGAAVPQDFAEILGCGPIELPILGGADLGDGMDMLVDDLAGPQAGATRQRYNGLSIEMTVGRAGLAVVRLGDKANTYDARGWSDIEQVEPVAPLERTVTLTLKHFEVLAELWADTIAHRAKPSPSDAPDSATPEDENAATPGREAASVDYQDRKAAPGTSTPPKVGERKKLLKPHAKRGPGFPELRSPS